MVTLGKRGDLAAHRRAFAFLASHDAVKKLFDEIAPRFKERPGGYTRVVKFGVRRGDAAPISVIEFTGASEAAAPRKKRRKTDTREHQHGERRAGRPRAKIPQRRVTCAAELSATCPVMGPPLFRVGAIKQRRAFPPAKPAGSALQNVENRLMWPGNRSRSIIFSVSRVERAVPFWTCPHSDKLDHQSRS